MAEPTRTEHPTYEQSHAAALSNEDLAERVSIVACDRRFYSKRLADAYLFEAAWRLNWATQWQVDAERLAKVGEDLLSCVAHDLDGLPRTTHLASIGLEAHRELMRKERK